MDKLRSFSKQLDGILPYLSLAVSAVGLLNQGLVEWRTSISAASLDCHSRASAAGITELYAMRSSDDCQDR